MASPGLIRRLLASALAAATVLALPTLTVVAGAPPAAAAVTAAAAATFDPSQFHGVTWSRLGDNFTADPLVLQGLSASDDYNTTRSKADAMFAAFAGQLGANTVRIPINPATASGTSYYGVIDSAIAHNFKVVLTYWSQDGTNMVSSSLLPSWQAMWDTITAKYVNQPLVYLDPINEPIGFTTSQWLDFAANFITRETGEGMPANRLFIEGAQLDGGGWGSDIRPLCSDSRFNGVYLAMHRYGFPYPARSYSDWVTDITTLIGNCASRTVIEEFGSESDQGYDYDNPTGTSNQEVAYLDAITDVIRQDHLGAIWCHTIGGRTSTPDHDTLDLLRLESGYDGSTDNVPLWIPDPTSFDRLMWAWGGLGSQTTELRDVYYNGCLDVPGASQNAGTQPQVAACADGSGQQWTRQADNEITAYGGTKCLEEQGTTNGSHVVIDNCTGASSQLWLSFSDNTVRNEGSKLCLDADLNGKTNIQVWACGNGTNQKWRLSNGVIGLRAHADGNIVTAENAGASALIANRDVVGGWETFDLIDNADGSVSLHSHANGDYVDAANSTTSVIADSTTNGPNEEFDLIYNPDGSYSFRAHSDGDYVTAENAGASSLIANRTAIGTWEEFDILP
jgi:Ricin-type beta-trefoil lectin domain/Cellulase (glycosyl hydrolase family 5)/Ricin-type beta-trefoil lectin domain-like